MATAQGMALNLLWLLGAGMAAGGWSQERVSLPDLPHLKTDNLFPGVRNEIEQAYAAAAAHPEDASLNGRLGMVLNAHRLDEAAEVCYRRAHLLDARSFRWLYYLGSAQAARGEYGEAAKTLRDALRLSPEDLPAQLKLGECLLAMGQGAESGGVYRAVLRKHPESAAAHYGWGRVRAAERDWPGALESYLRACELAPRFAAAHYALALTYRQLGEQEKAQKEFRIYERDPTGAPPSGEPLMQEVHALDLSPLDQIRLGIELEHEGKLAEAAEAHERALELNSSDVQAHINLISLYGRLGQFDKAEEHYREAVRLNPNQAEAHYNYGVLLFGEGRYEEAETAFGKALAIDPYYPEAHNNLGFLHERQGKLSEAAEEFHKALDNKPDYRLAHFHLGRILINEKAYAKGIEHLLKTITPEDENTPAYLYALGAAYGRAGDRENARRYLRQARDEAAARGQKQLLDSIEKDLQSLEAQGGRP